MQLIAAFLREQTQNDVHVFTQYSDYRTGRMTRKSQFDTRQGDLHTGSWGHLSSKKKCQIKLFYPVLTQHQNIIINTLVLATCFGFYQPYSGLCLLYEGTFSVHTHCGIQQCLHKTIRAIKV